MQVFDNHVNMCIIKKAFFQISNNTNMLNLSFGTVFAKIASLVRDFSNGLPPAIPTLPFTIVWGEEEIKCNCMPVYAGFFLLPEKDQLLPFLYSAERYLGFNMCVHKLGHMVLIPEDLNPQDSRLMSWVAPIPEARNIFLNCVIMEDRLPEYLSRDCSQGRYWKIFLAVFRIEGWLEKGLEEQDEVFCSVPNFNVQTDKQLFELAEQMFAFKN